MLLILRHILLVTMAGLLCACASTEYGPFRVLVTGDGGGTETEAIVTLWSGHGVGHGGAVTYYEEKKTVRLGEAAIFPRGKLTNHDNANGRLLVSVLHPLYGSYSKEIEFFLPDSSRGALAIVVNLEPYSVTFARKRKESLAWSKHDIDSAPPELRDRVIKDLTQRAFSDGSLYGFMAEACDFGLADRIPAVIDSWVALSRKLALQYDVKELATTREGVLRELERRRAENPEYYKPCQRP